MLFPECIGCDDRWGCHLVTVYNTASHTSDEVQCDVVKGSSHGVHGGFPFGDRAEHGPTEVWLDHLRGVSCPAPPFGEDNVADLFGSFAAMDHVSDGFIRYAAAFACGAVSVPMHSGGNWKGMAG